MAHECCIRRHHLRKLCGARTCPPRGLPRRRHLGNLSEAAACYQRELGILRELGDRWTEAHVLTHFGDTRHAVADMPQAGRDGKQALTILGDLQHTDADQVRAKLASTGDRDPDRGERATP
jgi:hypothetical protein